MNRFTLQPNQMLYKFRISVQVKKKWFFFTGTIKNKNKK